MQELSECILSILCFFIIIVSFLDLISPVEERVFSSAISVILYFLEIKLRKILIIYNAVERHSVRRRGNEVYFHNIYFLSRCPAFTARI